MDSQSRSWGQTWAQISGRLLVEHERAADPREAIFRLAVDRGWVILELAAQATSLEDVFVRLTTREEPAPEAAGREG